MFGSGFIIVGFSFATVNSCMYDIRLDRIYTSDGLSGSSPSTLCFIIFGCLTLICGVWYEKKTTRDCLFPETAFKDFSTGLSSFVL
jgi:hypothetical protein